MTEEICRELQVIQNDIENSKSNQVKIENEDNSEAIKTENFNFEFVIVKSEPTTDDIETEYVFRDETIQKTELVEEIIRKEVNVVKKEYENISDNNDNKAEKEKQKPLTVKGKMVVKYCQARDCNNDSSTTPNKIFVRIPVDVKIKEKWFKSLNVSPTKGNINTFQFCCEDHFDLYQDAENFIEFKTIGVKFRMKKDIVPHLNLKINEREADVSQLTLSAKKLREMNIEALHQHSLPLMNKGKMVVKYCQARDCNNDSSTTPNKIFVRIPVDVKIKEKWFKSLNVSPTKGKINTFQFCCEDHFDLYQDAENFIEFKTIGVKLRMKKDIVPHLNLKINEREADVSQLTLSAKKLRETNIEALHQHPLPLMNKDEFKYEIVDEIFKEESEDSYDEMDIKSELYDDSKHKIQNETVNNTEHSSTSRSTVEETHKCIDKRSHIDKKPYKCDVCDKSFRQKSNLTAHSRTHTGEKPFACDVCDKAFIQSNKLVVHKRTHNGEKPYKCDVCDKAFTNSSQLVAHKRSHTGEKSYKCEVCDKAFTSSGQVTVHKRMHTGEKPYECNMCDKTFIRSSYLITHIRTHTGEKPFACDVCSKTFAQSNQLIVHKRIHTREKPYKCDVCDKAFTLSSHLMRHVQTHSGGKSYGCNVCGKAFARSGHLVIHKRLHTGENPYKCNVCEKGFRDKAVLIRHIRTHTDEKPYKCNVCDKAFRDKGVLVRHIRTHTDKKPH